MRKLASLLTLFSLGLFAVGCNNADDGTAPSPDTAPATEGSSVGPAGDMPTEGETEGDTPPATDEAPPTAEEPAPAIEESAEGTPSATEAAEGSDAAEPAPAEGETAPQ